MENPDTRRWPALEKDDAGLLEDIMTLLTAKIPERPVTNDPSYARAIAKLPRGLRAMAATHWLDVSLALDSITEHFGNFGESDLVAETEVGLLELGLPELAECFGQARELVLPGLAQQEQGEDLVSPYPSLDLPELEQLAAELDRRAWDLGSDSAIYAAWTRYARAYPERVFDV